MSTNPRDSAADEISREDSRFKCRMCGKPIFGVWERDGTYDSMFYCSKDCQLAHTPCCICFVFTNVFLFIINGWFLAFLIGGVPMSMILLVVGLFVPSVIMNIILANKAAESWFIRKQIIKNKANKPPY
ncbi:MAG: hypothetical protein ACTSSE_18110 [Candidatus Thorarchaeota archaeon]